MESNSTIILTTISSMAGVGDIRVYTESMEKAFNRLEQVDESKLDVTSLATCFTA
jgi:hypothetical protein